MSRRLRERHLNLQRDEVLLAAVPRAGGFRVALCYPNLYFVGYRQPATGLLRHIAKEAEMVAAAIAAS